MVAAAEYAIRCRERSRAGATLSSWTAPFALPLFALGYGAGAGALGACLLRYPEVWGALGLPVLAGPVIPAMLLLTAGGLAVGARHRAPAFFHLAAWLFVLPYTPLAVFYASRMWWIGTDALTGELWAPTILALVYFALAVARDVRGGLAPRVLYPPAYILAAAATLAAILSAAGLVTLTWLFGLTLVMCAWSAMLVASGHHRTYERWLSVVAPPELRPGARALFGYLCAWLFPLWLLIASAAWAPSLDAGGYGLMLTALAPLYLVVALRVVGAASAQGWPWLSMGVLLSLVGPWLALSNAGGHIVAHWSVAVLAVGYLVAAALLDKAGQPGARLLYALGYLLSAAATVFALGHELTFTLLFGLTLITYAWSIVSPPLGHPMARLLFGYLCAWLFPLWLLDALYSRLPGLGIGACSLTLVLLAFVYLAATLLHGHGAPERTWPWLSTGMFVSLTGPWFVLRDRPMHGVGVWAIMAVALLYLALGYHLDKRGRSGGAIAYPLGYLFSLMATMASLSAGDNGATLVWTFGLTLAIYAWSAWLVATQRYGVYLAAAAAATPPRVERHARALFGYLCAWLFPLWLFTVPLLWGWIPDARGGPFGVELALLASIYLCGAAYLRRRAPAQAAPWIAAGAVLAALGPLLAIANSSAWLAASAAATISLLTYTGAALTFRRPGWGWGVALILPLLAQALFAHVDMGDQAYYLLPHIPVIGALLATGDTLRARRPQRAWPRPFDTVACGLLALGLVYFALVLGINSINNMGRAGLVVVAPTSALLLAAYASWRRRRVAAWFGVGYGLIALQSGFVLWRVPPEAQPVCWAVVGLALTALLPRIPALWRRPVGWTAAALAVLSSTVATLATGTGANLATEQACMLTFAVVGLQLVTWGAERRERLPIYGGVALVGLAYHGRLLISGIAQPQFFVLPAGAYLLAVAYAEWRVAPRRPVKKVLEWSALLLTVGTSLMQATGVWADGAPSSVYDLLVIGEGLALLWLGNRLYWKDTLTVGAVALCIDAALIVKEPLRAVDTWYIVALAGLSIIGFVIAVEKKRKDLAVLVGQWRRLRETWD